MIKFIRNIKAIIFSNLENNSNYTNITLFEKIKIIAFKSLLIIAGLSLFIGLVYLVIFISIFLFFLAGGLFLFFFIKGKFLQYQKRRNNLDYQYGKSGGYSKKYNKAYKMNYKSYDND